MDMGMAINVADTTLLDQMATVVKKHRVLRERLLTLLDDEDDKQPKAPEEPEVS